MSVVVFVMAAENASIRELLLRLDEVTRDALIEREKSRTLIHQARGVAERCAARRGDWEAVNVTSERRKTARR